MTPQDNPRMGDLNELVRLLDEQITLKRDCSVCDGDGIKDSGRPCGGCEETGKVLVHRGPHAALLTATRDALTSLMAERDGATLKEALAFRDRTLRCFPQMTDAARDVLAERRRQVEAEGWTPEHDDAHDKGELSAAAGVYALAAASHDYRWVLRGSPVNDYLAAVFKLWPFERSWFKPKSRRQDKVKAAALLLADIEREDRTALSLDTNKGADQ